MKRIGNTIYIEKDIFSKVNYVHSTSLDKEWLFMREIKDIILIIFSHGIIIYVFGW